LITNSTRLPTALPDNDDDNKEEEEEEEEGKASIQSQTVKLSIFIP
jgi:hypothetical protein